MNKICAKCHWWRRLYPNVGQCRRFPPILAAREKVIHRDTTTLHENWDVPKTVADWDCGEFLRSQEALDEPQ